MSEQQATDSVEGTDVQAAEPVAGADDGLLAEGQQPTAEGDTTAGDEQQQAEAPEAYEFNNLPEGFEVDEQLSGMANSAFKEAELSQAQADIVTGLFTQYQLMQVENFNQRNEAWAEKARTDPEIGGDQFEENLSIANVYFKTLPQDLKDDLTKAGLVNHVEVIRLFRNLGRPMQEDVPGAGQATSREKSRIEKLYGTN